MWNLSITFVCGQTTLSNYMVSDQDPPTVLATLWALVRNGVNPLVELGDWLTPTGSGATVSAAFMRSSIMGITVYGVPIPEPTHVRIIHGRPTHK